MQTHTIVHVAEGLPLETCANCGHAIGIKETPHIWRGSSVVCTVCREILEDQQLIFRAFGKAVPGFGAMKR